MKPGEMERAKGLGEVVIMGDVDAAVRDGSGVED